MWKKQFLQPSTDIGSGASVLDTGSLSTQTATAGTAAQEPPVPDDDDLAEPATVNPTAATAASTSAVEEKLLNRLLERLQHMGVTKSPEPQAEPVQEEH